MGGACGTPCKQQICKLGGKRPLKELGVGGKLILKQISYQMGVRELDVATSGWESGRLL